MLEISKKQCAILTLMSIFISFCTFISLTRYVVFDSAWHIPLSINIFHNDTYPPRDIYRPEYFLTYHYGGDLLASALQNICKINPYISFEIISGITSGVLFFSLFVLAWLLTKSYAVSFISAFCCYFGAGFSWLNEILKNIFNPTGDFIKNFLTKGIHGSIIDAPSIVSFSTTSSIGYPVIVLCLFLFSLLLQENNLKKSILKIISLLISLFSLSLFAGWLSMTFIVSSIAFIFIMLLVKRKEYTPQLVNIAILFVLFFTLNIFFGNQMYFQEKFLGRADIFNIGLQENPFTVKAWATEDLNQGVAKVVSCFSWEFISNFGLSLLLLPFVIVYLKTQRNKFAFLLFLTSALTMPLPVLSTFKLNPVDFNRLFGFGNVMLILLITCGLGTLYKNIFLKKQILFAYVIFFCLSPFLGFSLGTVFTPRIYLDTKFMESSIEKAKSISSMKDFLSWYKKINKDAINEKYAPFKKYKEEVYFLKENSKKRDVAISTIPAIPVYAGVYTLIPSMVDQFKDLLYSNFDNIYSTIISTLDPHLIEELNVKWIGYDEPSKNQLPKETLELLNNSEIFMLAYSNNEIKYELYSVSDLSKYTKTIPRKTGWILVNKDGIPVELLEKRDNNINHFSSEADTLKYLKQLVANHKNLKKQLITAQPIIIKSLQDELAKNSLNITLVEKS